MANTSFPDSGILFDNDGATPLNAKDTDERKPAVSGDCEITCPHCKKMMKLEVAGWPRKGPSKTFYSLKFQPPWKDRQGQQAAEPAQAAAPTGDIPF